MMRTLEDLDAERLDAAIMPFKGRILDRSKPVKLYRNLHARSPEDRWSLVQGCHVVAHSAAILLRDVRFKVSASGLARMRRLRHKVVCAFAIGHVTGSGVGITATCGEDLPTRIAFDPMVGAFVDVRDRKPQRGAMIALFNDRGCTTAYGYEERP